MPENHQDDQDPPECAAARNRREAAADGIHVIDSGYVRPGFDAVHLVEDSGQFALVDTGTAHSVGRVQAKLQALGGRPESMRYIILTHVHLDHAGGAGAMMQAYPEARLVVHPRGARHMADPSKLWAGTVGVYGEELAKQLYGGVTPIDSARIDEAPEGHRVTLGSRTLVCHDTPGHARHHNCILDERARALFTGDTFGISYPELDVDERPFLFPSSTPVQFDPAALRESIARMAALEPETLCLTHYGRIRWNESSVETMLELVSKFDTLGRSVLQAWPDDGTKRARALRTGMRDLLCDTAREWGVRMSDGQLAELLDVDIRLNADGIESWLGTLPKLPSFANMNP